MGTGNEPKVHTNRTSTSAANYVDPITIE